MVEGGLKSEFLVVGSILLNKLFTIQERQIYKNTFNMDIWVLEEKKEIKSKIRRCLGGLVG